jgi:hypothetical protein
MKEIQTDINTEKFFAGQGEYMDIQLHMESFSPFHVGNYSDQETMIYVIQHILDSS